MNIDKLIVRDIASLRGEHTVDFQNMLAKEGLFAITGPTGSGKSTLLSAMSLALYGQGAKKGLAAKDYVSEGAASGEITLDFAIEGRKYRSYWSCSVLKKDGAPRSKPLTKSYLEDLETKEILEISASDIVKLTLDQFNQCVILHQGEFANFLTSTFSERRVILEKLVNIAELERLKDSFLRKYTKLDKSILTLRERANSSEIFSKEEYQELLKNKETLLESTKEYQDKYQQFETICKIFEKLIEYRKIIDETKKKETQAGLALELTSKEYQQSFSEYQQSEETHKDRESEWQKERPRVNESIQTKMELDKLKGQLELHQSEHIEATQKISDYELKLEKQDSQLKSIQFKWLPLVREEISSKIQELKVALEELLKNKTESSKLLGENEIYSKQLIEIESKAKTLKEDKETLSMEQASKFEEDLIALQEGIKRKSLTYNKLQNDFERFEILSKKYLQSKQDSTRLERPSNKELKEIEREIELKESISNAKNTLLGQYETIENLWNKSIQEHQCQLCGNEHPTNPLHALEGKGELEADISRESLELDKLKRELTLTQDYEAKYQILERENSRLKQEIAELTDSKEPDLEKLRAELKENILRYSDELEEATQKHQEIETLLLANEKNKSSLINLREQYLKVKNRTKDIEAELRSLELKFNQILDGSALIVKLTAQSELTTDGLDQLKDQIYHEIKQIELAEHLTQNIDELSTSLSSLKTNIGKRISTIEDLKRVITELSDKIPSDYRDLNLTQYQIERDDEVKKSRDELWSLGQQLAEKKLSIERAKEGIGHIKDNLKSAEEWLLKYSAEIGQNSKTALTHFKVGDLWHQDLSGLASEHVDFKQMSNTQLSEMYEGVFKRLKIMLKEESDEEKTLLVQTTSKIELYEKKLSQAKELTQRLKLLEDKFKLINSMKDFFWRNDFKNYVLSMIEEELIYITNDELAKLCEGRYQLSSKNGTNGPEFVVIDKWISLTERKVGSLSGGETFMVSLALSLGLAEMTRGKTQIDSFFIDEGFGSLDSETLDSVTEVLLGLRGRGKTIGVISHVEALTARLPRSLILSKKTGGQSTISYQEMI